MSRLGVKLPRWENEGKVSKATQGRFVEEGNTPLKVNRRRLSQRLDDRLDTTEYQRYVAVKKCAGGRVLWRVDVFKGSGVEPGRRVR